MRIRLLYLCSSQFSGSTLLSFLLNSHSKIATIGHTTGWKYSLTEDFRCSCTRRLTECPLFTRVRAQYEANGLEFDARDFGTAFNLSVNTHLNRLLLGPISGIRSSWAEHVRDRIVCRVPAFRDRLARQELANVVLIRTVLDFHEASVYLDNSHSPYRFRRLSSSRAFDTFPIHLVRDPRGVSLSLMTNSGYSPREAVTSWIRHQLNIIRITNEAGVRPLQIRYESLCRHPDVELTKAHEFAGLDPEPAANDFKAQNHHILGNRMRLNSGRIRLDERWRDDLPEKERDVIEHHLESFCARNPDHSLTAVIQSYLTGSGNPAAPPPGS